MGLGVGWCGLVVVVVGCGWLWLVVVGCGWESCLLSAPTSFLTPPSFSSVSVRSSVMDTNTLRIEKKQKQKKVKNEFKKKGKKNKKQKKQIEETKKMQNKA